jgi:glycosyltransferase involved in cell wall biosynthesis
MKIIGDLVKDVHQAGARLIYSLDDNFLDIPADHVARPNQERLNVVEFLLRQADGLLVTTPFLADRFKGFNDNIVVLPHALDEQLLVQNPPNLFVSLFPRKYITIGYMGTFTHDDDLAMIMPALQKVSQRHSGEIELQIIGVLATSPTRQNLEALPVRYLKPLPGEEEYPYFMLWFTGHTHWDIAISPLRDTVFNRSKSDIKFLDYCALGAAGIYSDVQAYRSTVHHLETGWVAENTVNAWEAALETLITDQELRFRIGQNAYNYLYSQRTLAHRAHAWVEALDRFV